jgi:1-acyl-sn-glycerol-3-phosphate acyltransferase
MSIEKFGQFLGKTVGKKAFEFLEKKVENFDVQVNGMENLEALRGQAFVLVSNHQRPKKVTAKGSWLSPDAFILSSLSEQATLKKLKIVSKSDNGWWAESDFKKRLQKEVGQPFNTGFSRGTGTIPVQKNPGSFNRDFVKTVDDVIKAGEPILIFPEGQWYEDFSKEHELDSGPAHIAKKYNIKIIPAYIKGADTWDEGQKVQVSFGESFSVDEQTKEEITEKIRNEIEALQKQEYTNK